MNLICSNNIVTDHLAINIDLTNTKSWLNNNSGLTIGSITKWNNAVSSDLHLLDFGLTGFDNGLLSSMNTELTLTQNNTKLVLNRVGYNTETGGTFYSGYTITPYTGTSVGNYFNLTGGYLQGFFKLENYKYEILPPRYNNGITIETIIEILPQSEGIFFFMGTRAEDKYSPYFSGETIITGSTMIFYGGKSSGYTYQYSGITTSEGNYLVSFDEKDVNKTSFSRPEEMDTVVFNDIIQNKNIGNNIISFEITYNKKLRYKYANTDGILIQNDSPNTISKTGWTIIDIVYKPYSIIDNYNPDLYECYKRRKGDLIFYINGRLFWKISDFDEFYFKGIMTDKEKQLGVPYNIGWGGGSFGLKHSWHFNHLNRNEIIQDETKDNLFVEKYFNSTYIGNIQKLRIYDIALQQSQILNNVMFESTNTLGYGITVSKGGRIINK